jgi:ribosome biogenesis GTPase / thiamine phosphate phosphatase
LNLKSMGWSDIWNHHEGASLARIVSRNRGLYRAMTPDGVLVNVHLSGRMHSTGEFPAVGDWCTLSPYYTDESDRPAAIALELLGRKSFVSRVASGTQVREQILAANVDFMFIVTSANSDFSINRTRRFCVLAKSGQVEPVVVISKSDLAVDLETYTEAVGKALPGVAWYAISNVSQSGISDLSRILSEGRTAVLVGSSGVGKSTLMNSLIGREIQKTALVRESDEKGRHTTSSGLLHFISDGGMIIDTPGLREVQILGDSESLGEVFPEISAASRNCKFRDCSHNSEPGCAVKKSLEDGTLSESELKQYEKLLRELASAERKIDRTAALAEKKKWRSINKGQRQKKKVEGR